MSQVEIVVTARNNATAGLNAARSSIAGLSAQMRDAQRRARELAQAERDAVDEVRRLDRVVRFFGSAATEEMRDNLAAAQIRLNDVRNSMQDLDNEADQVARHLGQANMAAAAFAVQIRNADRGMERLNREFNRWDRVLRRGIGERVDRIGDSIRQMASSAVAGAIGAVSNGLQLATRHAMLFAASAPAIAGLAVVLAAVVGNLTGLASAGPAAFLAGASAAAVFKLGLKGVSEAFEAGLSGDVEKFRESMKGLTVEAQDFVAGGLMVASAWKQVQRVIQSKLLAGLGGDLRQVNANLQPLAEKWLPTIASLFNRAARGVADFFKSAGAKIDLDTIMAGVARHIDGITAAIPYLVQAFTDIGSVGAAMFGDLGKGIEGAAKRFAEWIRGLKESGELQRWADQAKETFQTIGQIAENVGRVIASVFKNGADEGQTFLENVEEQTRRWAEFMESADGQRLVDSLGTIGAAMGNLVGVIVFLSEVWLGWVAVFESGIDFISRGWNAMVEMAVAALGAILDALVTIFGNIPIIGDMLKQSQRNFEAWRDSSTNSLNQVASNALETAGSVNQISGAVHGAQSAINQLHGKTVYIDVIERKFMSGTLGGSGGYRGFAHGGIATGMKWVGERGPELVDFGAAGGRVTNHEQSREMARQGGGGGGGDVNITVMPGPGAGTMESMLLEALRNNRMILRLDSSGRVKPA
jgi:hypothetical protein